jgi:pimeloyl-ACP methyl ester carboxylesterase
VSASGPREGDSRVVRVGGLSVRVRVQGEGAPLLLLNGVTRPLESWAPLAEGLRDRTLVSFDAPGVGGSPTPILPLSISMLARIAEAVLDETDLDRADVLGFSHGGAVAQQLAFQAPSRVSRLVLAATTCGVGSVPSSADALRSVRASSDSGPWPRPDILGTFWHGIAIATWSSIPFLGAIAAPTLVVCGSRDRVVPPANSRLLARRIPGAVLVLLQAGHDLQRAGQASMLADAVESFLTDAGVLLPLPAGG